jgi:serine/threonine-protein kinase
MTRDTGESPAATTPSAPPSPSLEGPERLIGTRVLDFEIRGVLGTGGMSVVYRAQHHLTGQEVAIKILPPELAVHEDLKARFVEEARVLARLEHPNIVSLNNFTEAGRRLCLVMQFVEGITFEQKIIDGGKVEPDEAVRIGIEVLRALEYAHAQNVIHRDIKPSNVLLRPDGAVKVTDFGIAKILGQTKLTGTGQTMGTVRYMSPEQVRGKPTDARSDVYSLGMTLYEAVCGQTAFDGDNQFEIMQKQLTSRPPPMASLGATVPAALEKAIFVALEKDARSRYRDATAFRERLEAVAREFTTSAGLAATVNPLARRAPSRRALAAGLGLGVALVAAGGAAWMARVHRTAALPSVVAPPAPIARAPSATAAPAWPAPHAVSGLRLAVDQTFTADGLRVQSAAPRDAARLRDRVQGMRASLASFLRGASPAAARGADAKLPLNLVVLPEALLNRADLWPGYHLASDSTYPSRYVEPRRTLFVHDAAGFEGEIPYGLALHVLAPVRALSNADCTTLAEQFESYWQTQSRAR